MDKKCKKGNCGMGFYEGDEGFCCFYCTYRDDCDDTCLTTNTGEDRVLKCKELIDG